MQLVLYSVIHWVFASSLVAVFSCTVNHQRKKLFVESRSSHSSNYIKCRYYCITSQKRFNKACNGLMRPTPALTQHKYIHKAWNVHFTTGFRFIKLDLRAHAVPSLYGSLDPSEFLYSIVRILQQLSVLYHLYTVGWVLFGRNLL